MAAHRRAGRKANYGPFLLAGLVLLLAAVGSIIWVNSGGKEEAEQLPPPEPTITPEPTPIPPDMFEWKPGEYVHVEWGEHSSNTIDDSIFATPEKKTAADLVAWAEMAWDNQWGYVWGTFGTVLTEDFLAYKLEQYGDDVAEYESIIREKWMDRRVVDCAGLIKGYSWYEPGVGVEYNAGDMPDWGTQGFYDNAVEKGPIDTLPEVPGMLVYSENGHIGVYIGGGWAIEAISHAGGVVKTRVADRTWTHWLKCPYIEY